MAAIASETQGFLADMAPIVNFIFGRAPEGAEEAFARVSEYLLEQWQNPSDILSVLMLLGPDIVQRSIAQLAGRVVTPCAFSFGWVAYSASALVSSLGDGRLMPDADIDETLVIGAKSGHCRSTKSWILGRLLRDFNDAVDQEMSKEVAHVPPQSSDAPSTTEKGSSAQEGPAVPARSAEHRPWEALRVTVFEFDDSSAIPGHGTPTLDWVWLLGPVTILIQIGIALIPFILHDCWDILLISVVGNFLAVLSGSLPQWSKEKWACPKNGGSTVTITQGNGSRTAMVIVGKKGVGPDLEILARGTRTHAASRLTRVATCTLALLWVLLLVTVAGMKRNSWYLMGVGIIGSAHNIIAAGAKRSPAALGLHLKQLGEPISDSSVAAVLKKVEERYEFVGSSLLDVFYPGGFRVKNDADIEFWEEAIQKRKRPNEYGVLINLG
ncbi:hypothetical protein TWF132_001219 [Orbilia oligospora]|nr:hypothetical protein TWF132_001219 [Orbilia oligospora]